MTSVTAQRLQGFRRLHDSMMARPERADDFRLYELSSRIRVEALALMAYSTLDLDFLGFLSREKAAGRTYSSQALARQVFSQAGVVAPPESLISEIPLISGQGAKSHGV